jgi:predicted RNase H-like nuclease
LLQLYYLNIYPHDAFFLISGLERFFPYEKVTRDGKKIVESAYQELTNEIDRLIGNPSLHEA